MLISINIAINCRLTIWKPLRCSDFSFLYFLSSYPFSLFFSSHFYNLSGELLPYPPHAHLSFPHYQSSYLLKMTTKPTGHSCCLTPRNFQVPPNSLETWEKQNQNSSVFSCARYSYFQLLVNVRVTGTLVSPQKRCQRFLSKCEKEGLPWWSSG